MCAIQFISVYIQYQMSTYSSVSVMPTKSHIKEPKQISNKLKCLLMKPCSDYCVGGNYEYHGVVSVLVVAKVKIVTVLCLSSSMVVLYHVVFHVVFLVTIHVFLHF